MALLLSESTPIAFAGLLLVAPLVLVLYLPIFYLARTRSSNGAKGLALGLALLLVLLERGFNGEFGLIVSLFFYLPLAVVLYKMVEMASKG